MLRLVAARRMAPARGLVRFHPRLTILQGFDRDAAAWLADLLSPNAPTGGTELIASLDLEQLPDGAHAAYLLYGNPVLDAARLRHLLDDGARESEQRLRARADELARRIADLQVRRRDCARRRARAVDQLEAAEHAAQIAARPVVDEALRREIDLLTEELRFVDAELEHTRPTEAVHAELAQWQRVLSEANGRLARCRAGAARVDPVDVATASRLHNDWRYAERVFEADQRRRSRREADERRAQYEAHLAALGATSYDDLAAVGTGFGRTASDVAIREAAAVVSMAQQRCEALQGELDAGMAAALAARRARAIARTEVVLGHAPGPDPVAELEAMRDRPPAPVIAAAPVDIDELGERIDFLAAEFERLGEEMQGLERESGSIARARYELADRTARGLSVLGPVAVESLLGRAIAPPREAPVLPPVIVGDIAAALSPRARRRAFDYLVSVSRSRQVIWLSDAPEITRWAGEIRQGQAMVWTARQAEACA